MNRQFKETFPRSQKDSYNPNDNISFLIRIPDGMELVRGSITVQGELLYTKNGAKINLLTDNIFFDGQAGIHCFFDNWVTNVQSVGITEHLNEYARYVKMLEQVNSNDVERMTTSVKNLELKCAGKKNSTALLAGLAVDSGRTPFSFKPMIAINRSNRNISSNDFQEVVINFVLQDQYKACYGATNVPAQNPSYTIQGLKITYMTQPAQVASEPLSMKTVSLLRHTVDSQLTNVEMVLPIDTLSMASSLVLRTNWQANNQAIDAVNVSLAKFTFNDSNGKLVSFNVENYQELQWFYSKVLMLNEDGVDSLSPVTSNYGIGINFEDEQKAGNKVTLQLRTDADGNNIVYELFSYLSGTIQLM